MRMKYLNGVHIDDVSASNGHLAKNLEDLTAYSSHSDYENTDVWEWNGEGLAGIEELVDAGGMGFGWLHGSNKWL